MAAVTLAQLDLPDKKTWDEAPLVLYGAVLLLALVAVDESVRATVGLVQLRKIRAYEGEMRAVLSAALIILVRKYSPPWERVGAHAFQLRGFWRWRRLTNIGGIRIGSVPSMVNPSWKPGKGVVGMAVKQRQGRTVHWTTTFDDALRLGERAWTALPADERFGLSWGELIRTENYAGITAFPIYDRGGRLTGCVCIDAPLTEAELGDPSVQKILRDLARSVDALGSPPVGWRQYSHD
ncbi:hypothetical protein AB0M02_37675 [Actinoplanes sp. NPDC051861]|uniref:hypothetical protein n=1 Tax=Actinoplanes sp. NPDC051861 TaxID=3155170 RepID=UPI003427BBDD